MEALNNTILDCLEKGKDFGLATIMTQKGSTPRTSGSRMVVLRDQTIFGTIGGGMVEAMAIEACLDCLDQKTCQIREFNLDKELKTGLDMVCGGQLTVLIQPFAKESTDFAQLAGIYHALAELEKKGQKGVLVSRIQGASQERFTTQKSLILTDGTIIGSPLVPKPLMESISEGRFSQGFPALLSIGFEQFIVEPVVPQNIIFIFGAGHVGFQLARTAHIADFQTVIVDDRKEFANRDRFPDSREVVVVDDFSRAFEGIDIDENGHIVIATRGHLHDRTVLEQALKTDAAYIGMIGSRPKRDRIYADLEAGGISRKVLNKVFSPIGLDIHSETPGEIAVSIMAQIIREKGRKA